MILTVEQLKGIVSAGGGLVLDGSAFTLNQLRSIIAAAAAGNATVTLHGVCALTAVQLTELATLAPGRVMFETSE